MVQQQAGRGDGVRARRARELGRAGRGCVSARVCMSCARAWRRVCEPRLYRPPLCNLQNTMSCELGRNSEAVSAAGVSEPPKKNQSLSTVHLPPPSREQELREIAS